MVKKSFYLILLLLASLNLYANNVKSIIFSTDIVNIDNKDAGWLKTQVESKLEANLSKYTNFLIINKTNKDKIIEEQKASEAFTQDSSTSIEVGQLKNANHGIFLTINKADSYYYLTLRMTDLTSGVILTTVQSYPKETTEELYIGNGCAVDEITVFLCENLKIPLTTYQKHILLYGDIDLSSEQKVKVYEEEVDLYRLKISDIDKEIEELNYSQDWEYILEKRAFESSKAFAEEKLAIAEANLVRAIEEANIRNEEIQKDAEQSLERQNKISAISSQLDDKVAELLSLRTEKSSSLERLNIIELKKKTFLEQRDSLKSEIDILGQQYELIVNEHIQEILNRPYRTAEMSQGMPTERAMETREKELEYFIDASNENYFEDLNKLESNIDKQLNIIMEQIENDYKELDSFTVNSLSDDLLIYYDEYDANIDGWPMTVVVRDDSVPVFTTETSISYKDITGKKPDYSDFKVLDDIDFYNSLFLRKEPIFIYQLTYNIKPFDKNSPSKYEIKILNLSFYDTNTVKLKDNVICSKKHGVLKVTPKITELQLEPVYDIRSLDEIEKFNDKEVKIQKHNEYKQKIKHHDFSLSYRYTFGDIEGHGIFANYYYTFCNYFGFHLKFGFGFPNRVSFLYKDGENHLKLDDLSIIKYQFTEQFGFHRLIKFGDYFYINPYIDCGYQIFSSETLKDSVFSLIFVVGLGTGVTIGNVFDIFINAEYDMGWAQGWTQNVFDNYSLPKSNKSNRTLLYSHGGLQAGFSFKL